MRNKHVFSAIIEIRCPYENCGKEITKTVKVSYVTNQRGDVIESVVE